MYDERWKGGQTRGMTRAELEEIAPSALAGEPVVCPAHGFTMDVKFNRTMHPWRDLVLTSGACMCFGSLKIPRE